GSLVYCSRTPSRGEMTSATPCCRRCAWVTAVLRNEATAPVAEDMRTLSSPAEMEGKESPTMSAMIVTTTIISRRVMPRSALPILPTDDIGIDSFAARLPVCPEAHDLGLIRRILAGKLVAVVHTPRIFRHIFRQVWAVPLRHIGRPHAQRLEALLGS